MLWLLHFSCVLNWITELQECELGFRFRRRIGCGKYTGNRTVAASYPEGTEPRSLYVAVAGSVAEY